MKSSSRKPTRSAKRNTPSRSKRTNRSKPARAARKAPARKAPARTAAARPSKASVTRSRATTPARSTHASVLATHAPARRKEPVPSPMPTRHVAPPRAVLVTPARSMPPNRDQRKLAPVPPRGALVVPDFTEAGVLLAITYSIREGRRGEFFDLMRELKPLLAVIGGLLILVTVFSVHPTASRFDSSALRPGSVGAAARARPKPAASRDSTDRPVRPAGG